MRRPHPGCWFQVVAARCLSFKIKKWWVSARGWTSAQHAIAFLVHRQVKTATIKKRSMLLWDPLYVTTYYGSFYAQNLEKQAENSKVAHSPCSRVCSLINMQRHTETSTAAAKEKTAFAFDSWKYKHYEFIIKMLWFVEHDVQETRRSILGKYSRSFNFCASNDLNIWYGLCRRLQ